MFSILSIVLSLFLVAPIVGCGSGSEAVDTTDLSEISLRIEGMTWGGWALAVRRALEGLDGVKKAEVSFRDKEAVVYFEKGKVTVDGMVRAVAAAGFRATKKAPEVG